MKKVEGLRKSFWKGNQRVFLIAFISSLLMNSVNLYLSYVLQVVTDIAAGEELSKSLLHVAIECVLVFLGMILVSFIFAGTRNAFKAKAVRQYRDNIFEKLAKKGIGAFRKENTSSYVSGLTNDVTIIEESYLDGIFTIGEQVFLFLGSLLLMLYYSPLLTLIAIGFSLLPVLASVLTGQRLVNLEKDVSGRNEKFLAMISEILTGFSVVKSFNAEKRIGKIFGNVNEALEKAKKKRNVNKVYMEMIGGLSGATTQIGVFIVGAWLSIRGMGITPGMLIVFTNLLNFIIGPIGQLPALLAKKKAALALIDKMEKALSEEDATEERKEECRLDHSVQLSDIEFSYDGTKKVLDHLSYEFEKGKSYAIVGASGCGKSTLLQLLLAGMNGYSGNIRYDDMDIKNIRPESLYNTVSTIQQNVFVFNASIRDNVTMFQEFPKEEVDRVIEMAGLQELIAEKGEDYLCGENGSGLSGGEKQRISIARALLRNAKMLLIDEATAALDAETSSRIIKAILALKNMTRIVVTHDLDAGTLQKYDSILTLKNGRIVEDGSFDTLMKNKGYFYSLYTVAQ
ncbi:MAG: ABC transporter ATP-binding protein [Lachnospiraceae bacterium]|jgi:ABC-type multidrug transport system fused ATPase/permease subunit|nr:ABC transporter ATP-binding protein [Lachnospiraceae bacterium]